MFEYAILCEKASAAKNFASALGGTSGEFEGHSYRIVHSHGHLMEFVDPKDQVPADKAAQYRSWKIEHLPWQINDFGWEKQPIMAKNPRTGRKKSTKSDLAEIKKAVADCDSLVIATDVDPSGEGELLAWEIINAIKWRKPVKRLYFADEEARSIQSGFRDVKPITSQMEDGDYLKSDARSKWDFLSMQLTRIATTVTKQAGYPVRVVREGRLKSLMVRHVYEQLMAIKNYKRKPFYEVKFQDSAEHVFARHFKDEEEAAKWRHEKQADAKQEQEQYHESEITNVKTVRRHSAPPKLLDLSNLASILAPKGYSAKEVLSTYQKMYEAKIVSYPRTDDSKISMAQFYQLLPLVPKIAAVVDVDQKLLTHRKPRFTHVTNGSVDHGANRPGEKVPSSLGSLAKYGKSGPAIYSVVAKNYLAMLGEDYEFDHTTAELKDYPFFKTAFNVPVALNYKLIFDSSRQISDTDEAGEATKKQLGQTASPFIFEGANKKPVKPTMKWLMNYLQHHNIGTGATRVSTLSQITAGTTALMKERRGTLSMTNTGTISAILTEGTIISSTNATKRLMSLMDEVGAFKLAPAELLTTATQTVTHDLPIMVANADKLKTNLGDPEKLVKHYPKKAKTGGQTASGKEVNFNQVWGGHHFSNQEVADLLAGKDIAFHIKTRRGKDLAVHGKLAQQTYRGHKFWGFKPADDVFQKRSKSRRKAR
ncbi:DNA topoisomerase I [Secundilactobacillus pentosiphilus]|uniref:DNA topoisomerase I n=1 Tax=Secundilactobacillus pentosiphilus TaxID=1714682 RepID=A0A1Z5INA3_9LACO|nr:DNA topoisomerase [Secundilactobacillus pentosiphilus]GAX02911.1 DNA topoisomerase I [Secundilactobacillus pentosiphilus]